MRRALVVFLALVAALMLWWQSATVQVLSFSGGTFAFDAVCVTAHTGLHLVRGRVVILTRTECNTIPKTFVLIPSPDGKYY